MERIKIAIIGCGQISEAHLKEIRYLNDADIVGVCDLQILLAKDTAARFRIIKYFDDYKVMVQDTKPDVVHILTPPHTHYNIGKYLLEKKCHIYVEKPICLTATETEDLLRTANKNNVMVCPGFMQLEDIASLRLKKYMKKHSIGDIVHIESYYGNSLNDDFSKIFLRTKDHWIHNMPGKLFQNIISHAIYHIIPMLKEDIDDIKCYAYDRSKNNIFQDELRVFIKSGDTTAYITFTSSGRPLRQFLKIYGTKCTVELDFSNHTFLSNSETELPGPIGRVRNIMVQSFKGINQGLINIFNFLFGKDRYFLGMGNLFKIYYKKIKENDTEPPVSYDIIRKEAYIMDEIAGQCNNCKTKMQC